MPEARKVHSAPSGHPRNPSPRGTWIEITFSLCLISAACRGAVEHVASKQAGYLVQLVALVVFLLAWVGAKETTSPRRSGNSQVVQAFLLTAVASAFYVTVAKNFDAAWVYTGVMFIFVASIYLLGMFSPAEAIARVRVLRVLAVVGVMSVTIASLQQAGFLLETFPGSDLASLDGRVRPASMTGSYLHYPIMVSLLVFVFLEAYVSSRKKVHLLLAGAFAVAVVASFSRSGSMIVVLGLLAFGFISARVGDKIKIAVTFALAIALGMTYFSGSVYLERLLSAVDSSGAGNETRIDQWSHAIDMWEHSPIVIGGYTGMVTNVTQNIVGTSGSVVESGLLQQLVSFGLLGTMLFYMILCIPYRETSRGHSWLRAGVVAAILETFVYQSIEVLPFMVVLACFPLVSRYLDARFPEAHGAQIRSQPHGVR